MTYVPSRPPDLAIRDGRRPAIVLATAHLPAPRYDP